MKLNVRFLRLSLQKTPLLWVKKYTLVLIVEILVVEIPSAKPLNKRKKESEKVRTITAICEILAGVLSKYN